VCCRPYLLVLFVYLSGMC